MNRRICLLAIIAAFASATHAAAAALPRFGVTEIIGRTPGAVFIRGAADATGRQVVLAAGETPGTVMLASRDAEGPWRTSAL